jgi:protein-tyrosine phosphatase
VPLADLVNHDRTYLQGQETQAALHQVSRQTLETLTPLASAQSAQSPSSEPLPDMARPRGGDWLSDEFRDLALAGVSVVVSMLTDAEAAELGLEREGDAAEAAGLEFLRLPTLDRRPPDAGAAVALARKLLDLLRAGASVAVHCRHGIGRSSTLAAVVLVSEGIDPADSWTRIAAARGIPVPDTVEQRELIDRLSVFR